MKNLANKLEELETSFNKASIYCKITSKGQLEHLGWRRSWRWYNTPEGIVWRYLERNVGRDFEVVKEQFKKRHPNLLYLLINEVCKPEKGYNRSRFYIENNVLQTSWEKRPRKYVFESEDYKQIYWCTKENVQVTKTWGYIPIYSYPNSHHKLYKKTPNPKDVIVKVVSGYKRVFDSYYDKEYVKLRAIRYKKIRMKKKKEDKEKKRITTEKAIDALAHWNKRLNIARRQNLNILNKLIEKEIYLRYLLDKSVELPNDIKEQHESLGVPFRVRSTTYCDIPYVDKARKTLIHFGKIPKDVYIYERFYKEGNNYIYASFDDYWL